MVRCSLVSAFRVSMAMAAASVSVLVAAETEGKVEGKVFTDWGITIEKDGVEPGKDSISHGFENHRAYFGYKLTVDEKFVGHVLLDVERVKPVTKVTTDTAAGAVTRVSTQSDSRLNAYAKLAYLQLKKVIPKTSVAFGLHGRYGFSYQEKFWGYRYLYKSFMDQNKYMSSADMGVHVQVKPIGALEVNFELNNGEGYKKLQMDNKYKAALGARIIPVEMLELYVYGDVLPYEDESKSSQITAAGFIGVKPAKKFRIGAEYDFQANNGGDENVSLHGISAYATVAALEVLEVFARLDLLSKTSASIGAFDATSKAIIAGVQWAPSKHLKLTPNVQISIPSGDEPKPTTKILASGEFAF